MNHQRVNVAKAMGVNVKWRVRRAHYRWPHPRNETKPIPTGTVQYLGESDDWVTIDNARVFTSRQAARHLAHKWVLTLVDIHDKASPMRAEDANSFCDRITMERIPTFP